MIQSRFQVNETIPKLLLWIITIGIWLALLPIISAQEVVETGEDHSGEPCGECHLDYHAAWETGVHAIAYERASFQDAWAQEGNDSECLACHVTDFTPATGEFLAENIQCEACHGINPADHPPETFIVDTSVGVCGDCHTATFDEWERSLHAFDEGMGTTGCATCHNPHGQTIRFETVDELCINCHQDTEEHPHPYAESYVHVTHNEIQSEEVDVTCASCHMFNNRLDELHQLPDHTMKVETVPCTSCHEELSETGQFDTLLDVDLQLAEERDELRTLVDELEVKLESAEGEIESIQGTDYVQFTQGLIIGLGLAITIIWAFLRRIRNGNGVAQ